MSMSRFAPLLALCLVGCFGTHHEDERCRSLDAQGDGACRAIVGYAFDGDRCVELTGCECVGADCDLVFNSPAECQIACEQPDTPPAPGACAAQDITGVGGCRRLAGWSWNGEACAVVGCECAGSDCDDMFQSQEACVAAYASCLPSPEPVPEPQPTPDCAPEIEGLPPVAPVCRPGAEQWYWTASGCQEGCACHEGTGAYGWPEVCPPSYDSAAACAEAHATCPSICEAQDARGEGGCRGFFGVAWDGAECVGIGGCECIGEDCGALYETHEVCEAAHAVCLPEPTPAMCEGDREGPIERCYSSPEVWWFTDRGCEPGCECIPNPAGRCIRSFRTVEECLWTANACGDDCGPGEISDQLCRGLSRWVWTGTECALTSACEGDLHDTEEACVRANARCG